MKHLIDALRIAAEHAERLENEERDSHAKGYYYGQRLAYADAASKLEAATKAMQADLETLKTGVRRMEGRLL